MSDYTEYNYPKIETAMGVVQSKLDSTNTSAEAIANLYKSLNDQAKGRYAADMETLNQIVAKAHEGNGAVMNKAREIVNQAAEAQDGHDTSFGQQVGSTAG